MCPRQLGLGELLVVVLPSDVVVVAAVVAVAAVVTVDVLAEVEVVVVVSSPVGLDVGSIVGLRVGVVTGGIGSSQPLATLIETSAQFQNCSGTPRPSGGMLSQTGILPGWKPSGHSYVS